MRSRESSERRPEARFENLSDFFYHCRNNTRPGVLYHYTLPNGREQWIALDEACELVGKIAKFLAAPDRAPSPTLDDGRQFLAQHNSASLTQHMRWASGLDVDSRPKQQPAGIERPLIKWPLTVQLWFWSNGGPPIERCEGTYAAWFASLRDPHDEALRYVQSAEFIKEMEVPA